MGTMLILLACSQEPEPEGRTLDTLQVSGCEESWWVDDDSPAVRVVAWMEPAKTLRLGDIGPTHLVIASPYGGGEPAEVVEEVPGTLLSLHANEHFEVEAPVEAESLDAGFVYSYESESSRPLEHAIGRELGFGISSWHSCGPEVSLQPGGEPLDVSDRPLCEDDPFGPPWTPFDDSVLGCEASCLGVFEDAIGAIDLETGEVCREVALGADPPDVTGLQGDGRALLACVEPWGQLVRIDLESGVVTRSLHYCEDALAWNEQLLTVATDFAAWEMATGFHGAYCGASTSLERSMTVHRAILAEGRVHATWLVADQLRIADLPELDEVDAVDLEGEPVAVDGLHVEGEDLWIRGGPRLVRFDRSTGERLGSREVPDGSGLYCF